VIIRTLVAAFALIGVLAASAQAEDREIAKRRAAERKTFTDAEIFEGFFKTAFGAELELAGRTDRIRKYDVPIRVFVENRAKPNRRKQVAAVVADIRRKIAGLNIAVTANRKAANVHVRLLRERAFIPALRTAYGAARARQIQESLDPQCISGFRKDEHFRIAHSDVFLVADTRNFIFYDCVYEELLQSLGPINDTDEVPWTMFNDDVQMGFFGVYDQYVLNILYHPRVRAGMTADEVRALLPEIMPQVRAFVAKANGLKE
jgi:DNA-binding Lrp family transcriptional regulator